MRNDDEPGRTWNRQMLPFASHAAATLAAERKRTAMDRRERDLGRLRAPFVERDPASVPDDDADVGGSHP